MIKKPANYTKARRRLLTKYIRRAGRLIRLHVDRGEYVTGIECNGWTGSFLRMCEDTMPWVPVFGEGVIGGQPICGPLLGMKTHTNNELRRGRFRVVIEHQQ